MQLTILAMAGVILGYRLRAGRWGQRIILWAEHSGDLPRCECGLEEHRTVRWGSCYATKILFPLLLLTASLLTNEPYTSSNERRYKFERIPVVDEEDQIVFFKFLFKTDLWDLIF